ncbi:MAG: secretin N-terminal domain-containing protein, partial [Thermoguttaceae bacterium]
LPDHVTIRAVVDKLTGSERKFEVIHLRRLAADYVAGTIEFMMGNGAKKEKTRSSPWFNPYDSPRRDGAENSKEFRVDADVEHNRLLLWANPIELASIEALLVKLGEIPAAGSGSGVRVIDGGDAKETQELIERLRRSWPSIAPNALQAPAAIVPPERSKEPAAAQPAVPNNSSTRSPLPKPSPGPSSNPSAGPPQAALFRLADMRREPVDNAPDERVRDNARPAPPPVKIIVGPDGKLIVSSEDPQALDKLEELAAQLATPHKDYRVFHLKYAWAVGVSLNLEDFFKDDKKERPRMPWWYMEYGDSSQNDSQDDRRLSKRRKLTFISDADSNTILVEGASAEQFRTIEELIQLYDQPPPSDTQSIRKTKLIHLKYSKAKAVADTVKDVYRDLLSANDKALAGNNQGRDSGRNFVFNYNDSDKTEQKTPKFKGMLSIGIDEISNSLMVSAPAYLFDHVAKMIEELDQAAAPDYTVQMVHVSHGMSARRMKELLDQVYMQKSSEKPPEERPGAKPSKTAKPSKSAKPAAGNTAEAGSANTEETR